MFVFERLYEIVQTDYYYSFNCALFTSVGAKGRRISVS